MSKKPTPKNSINAELKSKARIDDLKIQRNAGEITPEVIEMCEAQIDEMLKSAKKRSLRKPEELEEAAEQVKNDQEMLVNVSTFMDIYEEVLVWNKLIRTKKLDRNVVLRHREADIAFYQKKVCELCEKKNVSSAIHSLIYEHGHRNDK